MRSIAWCIAAVALSGMASCGGGGDSQTTPPPAPPPPPIPSGQLDATYGVMGTAVHAPSNYFASFAIAPDGTAFLTGPEVVKLDSRGQPDATFGAAGRVAIPSMWTPILDEAGNVYVLSVDAIVKLDPAGREDPEFGIAGRASVGRWAAGTANESYAGITRSAQGDLLVFGTHNTFPRRMAVAKFDRQGNPSTSFGSGGRRVIGVVGHNGQQATAAVTDAAGNIYVAGSDVDRSTFIVTKLDSNGQLASDFGVDGSWTSRDCNGSSPTAIALDGTGNVLVAGICFIENQRIAALFKVDPRGVLVAGFRDGGLRPDIFGSGSHIDSLAVTAGGFIYVGGYGIARQGTIICSDPTIAKLDADGNYVPAFGASGLVRFGVDRGGTGALAFDAHGRLYAGDAVSPPCPSVITFSFSISRLGP